MSKYQGFEPDWRKTPPAEGSYRSIFKWGAPDGFKHPNIRLYTMMKEVFGMTDEDFRGRIMEGNEKVKLSPESDSGRKMLTAAQISRFITIAGSENVEADDYARLKYACGKTIEEAIDLREGNPVDIADIVVHPKDKNDVREIVKYCHDEKIPVYVFGGGSSVNLGLRPVKGGITLVLSTHMNRLEALNEENQTATVQAGMPGPAYEEILNTAPEKLGAKRRYTCGHFPQSFEYSSVGGWIVTLGSGQQSTYYGDAGDLVISQEYVTPAGSFKTLDYPGTATGPKVNDIMKGSEGTFGVLVSVTMKIFRYMPENKQQFGFIFRTWEDAVAASAEISQAEFGMPSVFRISDAEETDVGLKLYGIEGTVLDRLMGLRGYKPMKRCLCIGQADGDRSFTKNVKKNVKKVCRKYGAMYLTGFPTKQWEHGRFSDPYMREDLQDYGIIIDTLETGVKWDNLHHVHQSVRAFIKKRPGTICMTHCSHFYPQGTNLYFIFIGKFNTAGEYKDFQTGVIDSISKSGGSLSHHHGVGKMIGPWMDEHLSPVEMGILRSLKRHLDPNNIMNPGGQMGLDSAG